MIVSTLAPSTSTVFARTYHDEAVVTSDENGGASTEETTEVVTKEEISETEATSEETTEASTEETSATEEVSEDVTTEETTEAETENTEETTEEDAEIVVFDHYYSDVDATVINTNDLFVSTTDPSVFTKNTNVVSNYEDVYIISFETVEEAKFAYSYYVDKVDFIVDLSETITVATEDEKNNTEENTTEENTTEENTETAEEIKDDNTDENAGDSTEDVADLSDINNSDDAISILNNIETTDYSGYIALIDSGAGLACKDRVSVIGDDVSDQLGHGTKMYNFIKAENADAKILSIKAFNGSKANVADIYAAIQYAIQSNVSVINLSFVGVNNENNSPVAEAINDALKKGIVVIGAAGNYRSNAKSFIPSSVEDVISVGAVNPDGTIYKMSNYNADLYVVASSTSEAAARYTGIYTAKSDSEKVFTELVTNVPEEETTEASDGDANDSKEEKTTEVENVEVTQEEVREELKDVDFPTDLFADYRDLFFFLPCATCHVYWAQSAPDGNGEYRNTYTSYPAYCINGNLYGPQHSNGNVNYNVVYAGENPSCTVNGTKVYMENICYYYAKNSSTYGIGGSGYLNARNDIRYIVNHSGHTAWGAAAGSGYSFERMIAANNEGARLMAADGGYCHIYLLQITPAEVARLGQQPQNMVTYSIGYKPRVFMRKRDANGNALNGATYQIYGSNESATSGGTLITEVELTPEGRFVTGDYSYAHYYAVEKIAPNGYNRNLTPIPLTKQYEHNTPADSEYTTFVDEKPRGMLDIYKYDAASKNKALKGAVFEVKKNNTVVATLTTGADGHCGTANLEPGTYTVTEKTAPTNYDKSTETFTVNVNPSLANNGYMYENAYMGYVFDADYYLSKNSDVNRAVNGDKAKAFEHFVKYGLKEGRQGCEWFNVNEYISNYSDIASAFTGDDKNLKAAIHFCNYGAKEGRRGRALSYYQGLNKGVNRNNTVAVSVLVPNVGSTPITIVKKSSNPSCTNANTANYSLNGAQYAIFKNQADAATAASTRDFSKAIKNANGTMFTFNIGADGKANQLDVREHMNKSASSGNILDTKFYILEYRTGKNYQLDKAYHEITVKGSVTTVQSFEVTDVPVGDPLSIQVVKEGDGSTAIEGAEFTVKFYAEDITKNYTFADLQSKTPVAAYTQTVKTNADGIANIRVNNPSLTIEGTMYPLGYLTVEETKAPEGFLIDGSSAYVVDDKGTPDDDTDDEKTSIPIKMAFVFSSTGNAAEGYKAEGTYIINDDGTRGDKLADGVTATVENIGINIQEEAISADFEITKQGEKGEPLEARVFEIKNTVTKEAYTFETDADGYYSSKSSYKSHSDENGMWFKEGMQDIVRETPDDEKGALTAGNYTVTEIDAKGHQKEEPISFVVTENGAVYTIYDNGKTGEAKVVCDMEMPSLGTLALVEVVASDETADDEADDTTGDTTGDTDEQQDAEPTYLSDEACAEIIRNFAEDGYVLPEGVQKTLPATKNQTITDICQYKNLKYNTDFTLYGKLMVLDANGEATPFLVDGKEVTAIKNFKTADTYTLSKFDASGVETVRFTGLDFTDIQGKKFVVFERIYLGELTEDDIKNENYEKKYVDSNNDVVEFPLIHEDETDKNQTVETPDGITHATAEDGTKTVSSVKDTKIKILDKVTYEGLEIGKTYTATGKLYIVKNEEDYGKSYADFTEEELKAMEFTDEDGKVITSSKSFEATEKDGSVVVEFEFDAADVTESKTIVVFEDVREEKTGLRYFTHAKVTDTQITRQPIIWTTAKGTEGRSELVYNQGKFIDTIHYENLDPNAKYLVRGVAMDKKTGELLELNGKNVSAEDEFTTGASTRESGGVDGSFDLEFTITEDQYEDIKGKDMVIFESLFNEKGTLIAVHNDINDKGQELTIPNIKTTLTDKKTGTHMAYPDEQTTLVDTVSYNNLIPGKSYVMEGTLMNKKTNTELLDENGKKITAKKDFVASESGSGTVDIVFTFNAKILKIQGTSIVAFEYCTPTEGSVPVGVHADINDKEQTVDIPKASTKVSKSEFKDETTVSFTDTIFFEKFIPGYTYVAKGWLVDQNGNKLTVDGKEISAEKVFKPTEANGAIDVVFPEFSSKSLSGKYVVFEEIYYVPEETDTKDSSKLKLIAEHKDLTDTNQMITITHKPPTPKTGDTLPLIPVAVILIISLLGIGTVIFMKKRSCKAVK